MWIELLKNILYGGLLGGEAALYGYLASEDLPISWKALSTRKFWERWSWTKATKTVLVGVLFGVATEGYGAINAEQWKMFTDYTGLPQIPIVVVYNLANTAAILGVEKLTKLVVRRTPLVKAWNHFKGAVLNLLTKQEQLKKYLEESTLPIESTPLS